ncbi:MAG: DUF2357 domain-containing protein [Gemmataceae bacterium]
MHIRISERPHPWDRWQRVFDDAVGPDGRVVAELPALCETSEIALAFSPDRDEPADIQLHVGNVLVASTRAADRPEFLITGAAGDDAQLVCVGHLLRDWVGQTELTVDVGHGPDRRRLLHVQNLSIAAGKLTQEVYAALCADVARYSASLLLDVYGKTFLGLEAELQAGETAPMAVLRRVRHAVEQLTAAVRDIARRPALRLRGRLVREPVLAEQSVGELTLQEACVDPTLAVRVGRGVRFRELIREAASPHFDLFENRVLTGFLGFLRIQIADLRVRILREIHVRERNRAYRDRRDEDGQSWWQREDAPRLLELAHVRDSLSALDADVVRLLRQPFLPPAAPLREVPRSTPLFRSHRAYAAAFQTIVTHFQAFRVQLDAGHLVARARSLPVLYEWWCFLDVLRMLKKMLTLAEPGGGAESPFQRLGAERDRFVIEFSADQWTDFRDRGGRLVRLRYVPLYRSRNYDLARGYGLLGPEPEATPDLALEIFPGPTDDLPPELIVVLDAKYSSSPHSQLIERVRNKYGRIGMFATGLILSRQVWALAPSAPAFGPQFALPWSRHCTVDNLSFWSDQFDTNSPVSGAIVARPLMPEPSPLEALLRWLLGREGLVLIG